MFFLSDLLLIDSFMKNFLCRRMRWLLRFSVGPIDKQVERCDYHCVYGFFTYLSIAFTWRRCFCYESERAYANARRFPPGWLAYVASLGELAKPWFQTTYGWRMKHTMVQLWMRFSGTFRYPPGSTYIDAHRQTCALKGALGPWIPGSIRKANELIHRSPAPNGLWSPTPPHCLVGQILQSKAPGRVP